MSDAAPSAGANRSPSHTQRFRRHGGPVLSVDQKRRQASVTAAAWKTFGSRDPMIAFLNTVDERLGGRPLDLAVNGEDGLNTVLAELRKVPAGGIG